MAAMVEVHVVNTLIRPDLRQGALFSALDFVNGLVAPSFLFLAGFSLFLSTQPRLDARRGGPTPLLATLGRIGLLWLLGYLLHIPAFSLQYLLVAATPDQWRQFAGIDVLQCIASSLLLLFLLRLSVRRKTILLVAVAFAGLAAVLSAPLVYRPGALDHLPLAIATYLGPVGSSLFPLLPWFGFLAAGAAASLLVLRARETGRMEPFMRRLLLTGLALAGLCLPLLLFFKNVRPLIVDERPHVLFFAARLGFVFMLLALCHLGLQGKATIHPLLALAGRESLAVYVFHLQALYQPAVHGQSLVSLIGPRLTLGQCLLASIALLLALLPPIWAWHGLKSLHPQVGRWTMLALFAGGSLFFLLT